jgi:hypothetical protein
VSGPAGANLATSRGIGTAAVRMPLPRALAGAGRHSEAELVRLMLAHRLPSAGG